MLQSFSRKDIQLVFKKSNAKYPKLTYLPFTKWHDGNSSYLVKFSAAGAQAGKQCYSIPRTSCDFIAYREFELRFIPKLNRLFKGTEREEAPRGTTNSPVTLCRLAALLAWRSEMRLTADTDMIYYGGSKRGRHERADAQGWEQRMRHKGMEGESGAGWKRAQ